MTITRKERIEREAIAAKGQFDETTTMYLTAMSADYTLGKKSIFTRRAK